MAFNNWDKLSKAQRDYPKPKFAVAVVEKALKKTPDNPYLLVCTFVFRFYVARLMFAIVMESGSCAPKSSRPPKDFTPHGSCS
jgi:hypothetical protein